MKKATLLILLIGSCLLMASQCNHKQEMEPYILTGRMVYDCNGTPAANLSLALKQELTMFNKGGLLAEVTTDENGYFRFEYTPEWSGKLRINSSGPIMIEIPVQKTLDLGDVNMGGQVNAIIKLEILNPYTENDTLYYYDWNYPNNGEAHWIKKIPGPFTNGPIDTIVNSPYMRYPLVYSQLPKMDVNYYLNSYEFNKNAYFHSTFCANEYSEVVLVVE